MAGQQHAHAFQLVHALDRHPQALLGDHIEADRRLVQQKNARFVQEGGGHFAAHTLAERKLAHRYFQQLFDFEGFGQKGDAAAQGCVIQFVDLAEEVERIHRRQVIP